MMLVLSVLLALVPLLGVAWVLMHGMITTVDGLFMSLILLAMSGILGLNILLELRRHHSGEARSGSSTASAAASSLSGRLTQRGKVQSVQFYESGVGEPNKSIVTLADPENSSRLLVFEGDMRNALPVGQKVAVTFRKESGHNVLVSVEYP
jgi:hypothetical protein